MEKNSEISDLLKDFYKCLKMGCAVVQVLQIAWIQIAWENELELFE